MTLKKLLLCLVLCATGSIFGMTYDNRFFPLLDKPILHQDGARLFTRFQPFYMFGNASYDVDGNDRPLFSMFGAYSQAALNKALLDSGHIDHSLLPPAPSNAALPWLMTGKVDAAGLAFRWYYSLTDFMDIGGSAFFAGSRSRLQGIFDSSTLYSGNQRLNQQQTQDFYKSQQQLFDADGVKGLLTDSFGISDLDFYMRFGFMRHYFLKFRTFDFGVKLGVIAPTASGFDLAYPSSLIFGGDKHWGMYVDCALDSELKEDLFAGLNMRFIQRFERTEDLRLPLFHVPNNFGILQPNNKGYNVSVTPGFTFVFSPYGGLANLRDGFGLQIGYTLILHTADSFKIGSVYRDIFSEKKIINTYPESVIYPDAENNVAQTLRERSKWGSEYITCSAVYDFAKNKECRGATPCVYFDIDIPISVVVAKQSFKTYGISLRIESDLW